MVPVSRYWVKLRCRCFRFPDFCSIPHKKKFQKFLNSRTSDDFDMKLGPVPKLLDWGGDWGGGGDFTPPPLSLKTKP